MFQGRNQNDAGAELIVTGDKDMLALGDHEGVRIVRLRAYLEAG